MVAIPDLVAPGITAIRPYEPGKPIEEVERELGDALPPGGAIKLASNESALGPSPRALEAVRSAVATAHLYPDGGCFYLRQRLARHHQAQGVGAAEISVGNGSNELIDLLIRTFTVPGDEVLAPARSFLCYQLSAQAHGALYREAERGPGFSYDVDALLAAVGPRTRMVFLANPDNPTGVYLGRQALLTLLRGLPPAVMLVLDEAYLDYAEAPDFPDGITLRGERELLVSLRTFSKAYGLAGLRCGYAVAPREVVEYLDRVRTPFNVNALAQVAARAALDDVEHLARARAQNREGMAQVRAGLLRLGLPAGPSQTNFLLVDVAPRDGRQLFSALLGRGVIIRPMGGYGLARHVRITIGTADENRRLLAALGEVLAGP